MNTVTSVGTTATTMRSHCRMPSFWLRPTTFVAGHFQAKHDVAKVIRTSEPVSRGALHQSEEDENYRAYGDLRRGGHDDGTCHHTAFVIATISEPCRTIAIGRQT